MKTIPTFTLSALVLGLAAAQHGLAAEQADSIAAALSGGKASLALRYRFEQVDQDGIAENGYASTLRTRLGFQSRVYNDVQATLEFDNNTDIIESNNDFGVTPATRPGIADPEYTEVNQAYLDYKGLADTIIRYGRQRVNFDNQRHVGGVGWRQNEQTYDALAVVNNSLADTTITLANVMNVNTITHTNFNGEDHQLIHVNNRSLEALNVSAYGLLLDKVSDTLGLRATGKLPSGDLSFNYALEYAQQETDNAAKNDTDYLVIEGGVSVAGFDAKLGLETLGSDNGNAGFQTPLGTKHAFNGWADKFLTTPKNGLEDLYLSLSTAKLGPKLQLDYHQFDANKGNADYGSEIDLLIAQKFSENYTGLIKFGHFSEGDKGLGYRDTQKIWLQLEATF